MGLDAWPLPAAWATSYGLVFALIASSITAVCCSSFLAHTSVSLLLVSLLLYCAAELAFGLLVSILLWPMPYALYPDLKMFSFLAHTRASQLLHCVAELAFGLLVSALLDLQLMSVQPPGSHQHLLLIAAAADCT